MSFYCAHDRYQRITARNDNVSTILSPGKQEALGKVPLSILWTSFEPFTRGLLDENVMFKLRVLNISTIFITAGCVSLALNISGPQLSRH